MCTSHKIFLFSYRQCRRKVREENHIDYGRKSKDTASKSMQRKLMSILNKNHRPLALQTWTDGRVAKWCKVYFRLNTGREIMDSSTKYIRAVTYMYIPNGDYGEKSFSFGYFDQSTSSCTAKNCHSPPCPASGSLGEISTPSGISQSVGFDATRELSFKNSKNRQCWCMHSVISIYF